LHLENGLRRSVKYVIIDKITIVRSAMEKLYYKDSMLREFSATVTGCEAAKGGFWVRLDRTAFYPEGGGQACDLGTLGGVSVLDVREEGEDVVHLCQAPLQVGSQVTGIIDWNRRFDLMQQHTGEHILSGLICARYGYHNVGFHVGAQVMEIDFDGSIPQEDLADLEAAANRAIWEDLPVKCWYPSEKELLTVPYRSKKALPWPVRIVEVPGCDICACCGVHVPRTGQIGLIKILSSVKFHEGVRLQLVCGERAYRMLCGIFDQNKLVSQTFSAKLLETGEAAKRMNDQLNREKLRCADLEKRVFAQIAESYVNQENALHFEPSLTPNGVRELADRIAEKVSGWAAVFSGSDEAGYSLCIISKTLDVRPLGTDLTKALNGRGGGKPGAFQGSLKATEAAIRAWLALL